MRTRNRAIFQRTVVRNSYLSANYHMMPHRAGPRDPRLRRNDRVRADLHVVPHVHQVIQLHTFRDARIIERATINCRVRADLYVISNFHDSGLRKFPVPPLAIRIAKPVRANHCARMNFGAMPDACASIESHPRMNPASLPNPATRANHAVRTDLRAITDVRIFSNNRVRPDANVFTDARQRCDDGRRMKANRDRGPLQQHRRRFRKSHLRLRVPQNCLPHNGHACAGDHANGRRSRRTLCVFSRLDVDQIVSASPLRSGNPSQLEARVTLKASANRCRKLPSRLRHI